MSVHLLCDVCAMLPRMLVCSLSVLFVMNLVVFECRTLPFVLVVCEVQSVLLRLCLFLRFAVSHLHLFAVHLWYVALICDASGEFMGGSFFGMFCLWATLTCSVGNIFFGHVPFIWKPISMKSNVCLLHSFAKRVQL